MSLVSWIVRKVVALRAPRSGIKREAYYLERALATNQRRADDLVRYCTGYCCAYCAGPEVRRLEDKIDRQEKRLEHLRKLLGGSDEVGV
jgi:hypothetical protein